MTKVITYGVAGRNETLSLTRAQEAMLLRAGVWPRNKYGHYTSVQYGLHRGEPTYTDAAVYSALADGRLSPEIALT